MRSISRSAASLAVIALTATAALAGISVLSPPGIEAADGWREEEDYYGIPRTGSAPSELTDLYWFDILPRIGEAGWEGEFISFYDVAVKMYVPYVLQPVDLTAEEAAKGCIAAFSDEDTGYSLSVMYIDAGGLSLRDYAAKLKADSSCDKVRSKTVNGIPAVLYEIPGDNTMCVTMATARGYYLDFVFSPADDDTMRNMAEAMTFSIMRESDPESIVEDPFLAAIADE